MITNQTIEKLKQKDEEAFDKIYLEYHALGSENLCFAIVFL